MHRSSGISFQFFALGWAARFGTRQITMRTEDALSDLAKIRVADKVIQIDRAVTQEIERLSSAQSISRRRRSWSGQIRACGYRKLLAGINWSRE
jgi:hypothetical protein